MDIKSKIKQRRLQMLVHSYIYYKLDKNIVDDVTWSRWAKELQRLQIDYPKESSEVEWVEAFKDWGGSSGAFLPLDNEWIKQKALKILDIHDRIKKKPTVKKQNTLKLF